MKGKSKTVIFGKIVKVENCDICEEGEECTHTTTGDFALLDMNLDGIEEEIITVLFDDIANALSKVWHTEVSAGYLNTQLIDRPPPPSIITP